MALRSQFHSLRNEFQRAEDKPDFATALEECISAAMPDKLVEYNKACLSELSTVILNTKRIANISYVNCFHFSGWLKPCLG